MRLKLIVVLLIFSAAASCNKTEYHPKPELTDCYLEELGETVTCGTYEVWEDREKKKGRRFKLNFIILPARASNPAPDPVFVFDGGPGAGAAEGAAYWAESFEKLRQEREIVLIDLRGTGKSNPLPCRYIGDQTRAQTYLKDLMPENYVKNCREKLAQWNDLRFYHITVALGDVDELREALGYDRINIAGSSYGGYTGIVYMKYYPQNVRSAFLHNPGVPHLLYPANLARDTELSLEHMFADCASDPNCAADYPNLREEFRQVVERLQQGPVTVDITNPINDEPESVTYTYTDFLQGFRALLYNSNRQRWAPIFIYWAARNGWQPVVEYTVNYKYSINSLLTYGMFLCVTCSEAIPYIDYEEARARAAGTFMGTYRLDRQQRACELWERGDIPADFHSPPDMAIPTLILTGEIDAAIPPYVGDILADLLPNSVHYMVPNAGHELSNAWENCLDDALHQFINQGSVTGLDFSCAHGNQRPPFASWRDYSTNSFKLSMTSEETKNENH